MRRSQQLLQEIRQVLAHEDAHFILYLDIAGFMAVNRLYGSEAGDQLLDALYGYLCGQPEILLCRRLFSDHFLAVGGRGPVGSDAGFREKIGEKLDAFLQQQIQAYPACRLRIACGMCRVSGGEDLDDCIDLANLARKTAKERGAEQPVLFGLEQRDDLSARFLRERIINLALREERFTFYLQPKVNLRTGEVMGAEALARRQDGGGAVVYPDEFLKSMEESGAVVELDLLICRKVCEYLAERIAKGLPVVRTSVNLSRLHIRRPGAAEQFHNIAMEHSIPSELLEFELTEMVFREDLKLAKRFINNLRSYGYRVSVDDFGHMGADVNIWQEMDFDSLKLDERFLSDDPGRKARNEALVPNLINMAHRMNTKVICEGVETEEQCLYLLRLGCSQVQGYYFSDAIPPDRFYNWYEKNDGRYEITFQKKDSLPPAAESAPVRGHSVSVRARWNRLVASVLLLVLLLGAGGLVVFSEYRQVTGNVLSDLILDELNGWITGRKKLLERKLGTVSDTLQLAGVVAEELDGAGLPEDYLRVLNDLGDGTEYSFVTTAELETLLNSGVLGEDPELLRKQLEQDEVLMGSALPVGGQGGCEITWADPVFVQGTLQGAVVATLELQELVTPPSDVDPDLEVNWEMVTDAQGNILAQNQGITDGQTDVLSYLRENYSVDSGTLSAIQNLLEEGTAEPVCLYLGTVDGQPYFLSAITLEGCSWSYLACMRVEQAHQLMTALEEKMVIMVTILAIAVLLVGVGVYLLLRQAKRESPDQRRRYFLLEEFSGLALFDYDCQRDVMYITPNVTSFMRIHNLEQPHFLKRLDAKFIYAGDVDEFYQMLSGKLADEGQVRVRLMRPDEEIYFWALVEYRYQYENGKRVNIIGKITDIDDKEQKEKSLVRLAQTDGLTGLYNKRSTEEKIIQQMDSVDKGALVMFDIDNFKQINDDLGHDMGDKALRAVGDGLRRHFRRDDVVGRIGGDEFIAFVTGVNERELILRKVEQMVLDIRSNVDLSGKVFSVSVGIAFYPGDGSSYPTLFKRADTAMYEAKRGGKHRCCFFEDAARERGE